MPSEEQRLGRGVLHAELARALEKPLDPRTVEVAGAALTVGGRDRASSSRSTFTCEPPERPVARRRCRLGEGQRLQVVGHDAEHLAADVEAVEGVDVEAIEEPRRRRHAACSCSMERIRPSITAVVGGLPRSWQRAPSMTATFCGCSRSSIRCRAWSTTISVVIQTSPSGCHSGSCGHPTRAWISGKSCRTTPRSSARRKPTDGSFGRRSSFSTSPKCARTAGHPDRSCSSVLPLADRRSNRTERQTARLAGRAGCRPRRSVGPPLSAVGAEDQPRH